MSLLNYLNQFHFNASGVKEKGQYKTYFVFTGIRRTSVRNELVERIHTLCTQNQRKYAVNLDIEKLNNSQARKETTELKNKIEMRINRDGNNGVQQTFDKFKNTVVQIVDDMIDRQEDIYERLEAVKQEEDRLKDDKDANQISFSFTVAIDYKDKKDLKQLLKEVDNIADDLKINLIHYKYCQDKAHYNHNLKKDLEKEIVKNTAPENLPIIRPFYAPTTNNSVTSYSDKCVFLGPSVSSNTPVFLDAHFSQAKAGHGGLLGKPGQGKTEMVKQLSWYYRKLGYQIAWIDPMGNYRAMAKEFNAREVDATQKKGSNVFDLSQFNSTRSASQLITLLLSTVTASNLSDRQKTELAGILAIAKENNYSPAESKQKIIEMFNSSQTGLKDFVPVLENDDLVEAFSDTQNVSQESESDCWRFSFEGVSENDMPLYIAVTLKTLQSGKRDKSKPMIIWIDEVSKFMAKNSNGTSFAPFIISQMKTGRNENKRYFIVDQSLEGYGTYTQELISLLNHIFLFKHDPISYLKGIVGDEIYSKIQNFPDTGGGTYDRFCYYHNRDNTEENGNGIFFHPFVHPDILALNDMNYDQKRIN